MTDNNLTVGDSRSTDIPVDWNEFTSEVQAVAAQKHRRLTRDKLFFYAWTAVLITAIAVLFFLLIKQKRELNSLIAKETADAQERIEFAKNDAFEQVGLLADKTFLIKMSVDARFKEMLEEFNRKRKADAEKTDKHFQDIEGDLGTKLRQDTFTEAKSAIDNQLSGIRGDITSIKGDKADLSYLKQVQRDLEGNVENAKSGLQAQLNNTASELSKRVSTQQLEGRMNGIMALLDKKAEQGVLLSYAEKEYVKRELAQLKQDLSKELAKKADKVEAPPAVK